MVKRCHAFPFEPGRPLLRALWLSFVLVGCAHQLPGSSCPDITLAETALDCPWAGVARTALGSSIEALPVLLRARSPSVWASLARDASNPALGRLWADSRNFDENAHATIVDSKILAALGARTHLDGDAEVVHAGVTHTYGYLFSTLRTPYGYKRARWVDGEIERGLGVQRGLLGPMPSAGTLLANVTCALAKIAITPLPEGACASAASSLREAILPATKARLEESVQTDNGIVTLRTDWVAYSERRGLFVYSVKDAHGARLITAFSADTAAWNALIAPEKLGDDQPVVARWNAVVRGVPSASGSSTPRLGSRRVLQ